jgi:hypothetical protein
MFNLEIDHRDEWCNVHETVLGNLDPLCTFDHDLKTYKGWSLIERKGPRPFVPPDDADHPKNKCRERPPPDEVDAA